MPGAIGTLGLWGTPMGDLAVAPKDVIVVAAFGKTIQLDLEIAQTVQLPLELTQTAQLDLEIAQTVQKSLEIR